MRIPGTKIQIAGFWLLANAWISVAASMGIASIVSRFLFTVDPESVLAVCFIPLFGIFFLFIHKFGTFAEQRGWILYRKINTEGLKAGILLDIDNLTAAKPQNQIEHLHHVRDLMREGQIDNEANGDKPSSTSGQANPNHRA